MLYGIKYILNLIPKEGKPIRAGYSPLPGHDRWHRELPHPFWLWLGKQGRIARQWVKNGSPIIPQFTMHSRSPHFVLLVICLVIIGMILPELFI